MAKQHQHAPRPSERAGSVPEDLDRLCHSFFARDLQLRKRPEIHTITSTKENNADRKFKQADELLVAELGSAFLCADLELHQEPREDNAAYIANCLEVLKNDNRAIFTAAAHAQRAADYLNQKAAQGSQPCAAWWPSSSEIGTAR
jgi:hypothetical protein